LDGHVPGGALDDAVEVVDGQLDGVGPLLEVDRRRPAVQRDRRGQAFAGDGPGELGVGDGPGGECAVEIDVEAVAGVGVGGRVGQVEPAVAVAVAEVLGHAEVEGWQDGCGGQIPSFQSFYHQSWRSGFPTGRAPGRRGARTEEGRYTHNYSPVYGCLS